jgi:ABC-type spermidine/putrescine transport system permease subunit II
MNRSFLIVLIPGVLLALGYLALFRYAGLPPGYGRLAVAMIVFFGGIWLLGRRSKKKADSAGGN